MEEILEILEEDSRYSDEQIAVMAGKTVEEVREAIRDYEEKSIIEFIHYIEGKYKFKLNAY